MFLSSVIRALSLVNTTYYTVYRDESTPINIESNYRLVYDKISIIFENRKRIIGYLLVCGVEAKTCLQMFLCQIKIENNLYTLKSNVY